jgi:hypothetical protein
MRASLTAESGQKGTQHHIQTMCSLRSLFDDFVGEHERTQRSRFIEGGFQKRPIRETMSLSGHG